MGIPISSGFTCFAPVALDERTLLTRQQMCDVNESTIPPVYFALCIENGKLYTYNVENTYVEYEAGGYGKYVEMASNETYSFTLIEPQLGSIEPGKKVVYGYLVEGETQAFCDVYVGLDDGYCACLSSHQRFVGMDNEVAKLLDLTLHDTTKPYNGWINVCQKTIYITAINAEFANVDELIARVKSDNEPILGYEITVAFDTDVLGNDIREYGRAVHTN